MSKEKDNFEENMAQQSHEIEPTPEGSLTYQEGVLNIIWFSCDGIAYSVVKKLLEEGNNVVIAQVQDKKDIDQEEDSEQKRRRLSLYDGILEKIDSKKVLKQMEGIENKKDWIVFFEFNDLAPIAEKVLKMGFTKGLFPTMEDIALEKDRDSAKDIVREHYLDLSLGEVHEFKSSQDGIQFLQETEKIWVLKGNSENAKTLVPYNNDPLQAKQILTDALESHSKDYEDGGYILEEKIIDGAELTPQMVWLDGEVIFTDIDIENKNVGAGNISVQTGAMQTLVIKSKITDKINKIAFPEWIHKQAKKHTGLFVADAGLICKNGEYFFTEFCFQRFGFDSFFAEQNMAGSCTEFFTKLFEGKNPLVQNFGVATRGMNMHKDDGDKGRRVLEGVSMTEDDEDTFIFECKRDTENEEKLISTGCGWDLVVFTGSGFTINEASKMAYEASERFAFEDLYLRPEFDMLSYDYPTSIPNRFSALNHKLFQAKEMEDHDKYTARMKIEELKSQLAEALNEDDEQE